MSNINMNLLNNFPEPNKKIFLSFIEGINKLGWFVFITEGKRSYSTQFKYWKKNKLNAKPGTSPHEFYRAIDINVFKRNSKGERVQQRFKNSSREYWNVTGVPQLARRMGLIWGDYANYVDRVHFEIPGTQSIIKKDITLINGEVIPADKSVSKTKKRVKENWNTEVGEDATEDEEEEFEEVPVEEYITKISEIKEIKANGIWQIVKLVADQYSLSQYVSDSSIAYSQGSLINFVKKVIQEPWLQFFGDTVDNQYYFYARKEPYDYDGYSSLPILRTIKENETISSDFDWYNGDIFSWYQIIPRGDFFGEQNLIFAYINSVFFEEYAEIWGSKPNIQVTNYLNFFKKDEEEKMFKKAIKDLKYLVESNAYLPFTREGVISIGLDPSLKVGYRIYNEPTNEFYIIDSVSHKYETSENGPTGITTIKVSRGIVANHMSKYFNVIDFLNKSDLKNNEKLQQNIEPTTWKVNREIFYFLLTRKQNANNG